MEFSNVCALLEAMLLLLTHHFSTLDHAHNTRKTGKSAWGSIKHNMSVEIFSNSNYQSLLDMTCWHPVPSLPSELVSWACRSVKPANYISRFFCQQGSRESPSVRGACVRAGRQKRRRNPCSQVAVGAGVVWSEGSRAFAQGFGSFPEMYACSLLQASETVGPAPLKFRFFRFPTLHLLSTVKT